jgi:hypothetical protein
MSRNSIKGHNSTSVAETNSVDMEETVSYDNTSKTQLQALPIGWIELPSYQCDTGQHIYIKTVVDKDYAKCLPKMCKVDRLSRNIQFYAHSKPCFGPVVENSFWEDFSLNIVLVISTFENMIRCPGIENPDFNPLRKANLPTGEIDLDGCWRYKK